MDWARFNRALVAKSIIDAEQISRQYGKGSLKAKDIDKPTWERIKKNDALFYKWLNDKESGADQ